MLATYPQYSPQAQMATPLGAALFAHPGVHAGNSFFGYEPGFSGFAQPSYPFAPFATSHPLAQTYAMAPTYPSPAFNPFVQTAPFPQSLLQSYSPVQAPFAPAQPIVLALGQLAQQIGIQGAVNQQIGLALQQLTHQLLMQGLPGPIGLGIGQPFVPTASPFIATTSPFLGTTPGVYGGFSPQSQPAWPAWGGQRAPTIQ
ncbi:MAG TPA: hypothetical protein VF931_02380 [Steroidobacteraceae bacterium]